MDYFIRNLILVLNILILKSSCPNTLDETYDLINIIPSSKIKKIKINK